MFSHITSVSFLVCTLLCVGSWSTDSQGVWSQTGEVLGRVKCYCLYENANSPEAVKFQNSRFSPNQMPPLHSAAQGACPLPPSRRHYRVSVCNISSPLPWPSSDFRANGAVYHYLSRFISRNLSSRRFSKEVGHFELKFQTEGGVTH